MRAYPIPLSPSSPPIAFTYPLRPPTATGARVVTAFREALDGRDRGALDELRDATLAFATTLKAEDVPPEQVLVSLKTALTDEGRWLSLFPVCCLDHASQMREHQLYAQVFGWYLEGYFAPPGPARQGETQRTAAPPDRS